jgi:presenilin-like A22 family membrane protease
MKHNLKITILLLSMFVLTQFIGIYIVGHYSSEDNNLPFGLEPPQIEKEADYYSFFSGIVIAFIFAIALLFLFTKFKIKFILKLWFFIVVIIALGISFTSIFSGLFPAEYKISLIALALAVPLAYIKIYKREFLVHNFTEFLIYPGIAAVFVPLLNIVTIIILLVLISIYDIWAVWHTGIMQKMAKYQIDKLKIFSGFFVPYVDKKTRAKIRELREKYRNKKISKKKLQSKKFKVSVAILGGGDIIFPIITAGVVMKTAQNMPFGLKPFTGGFYPALFVLIGATLGLAYLFFFAKKKKFYPAMPFITVGIFLGLILSWIIF